MLDRGVSLYVPYILEEKPELRVSYSGFTYYPNCISLGTRTFIGAPPIFGGYEYTPLKIQKRQNESLKKKYNEALFMLPRLMADSGFNVMASNLPYIDVKYPNTNNINVDFNEEDYSNYFLRMHRDVKPLDYYQLFTMKLLRFSFLRLSPLVLRSFAYDSGFYLYPSMEGGYSRWTMSSYAMLNFLPDITLINNDDKGSALIMINNLTHSPVFFEAPDYIPSVKITNKGSGPFANEEHYHVNIASFLLLEKYFNYLKENGVYDNTRIIIVSDHGDEILNTISNNIKIPNGQRIQNYNSLLLVKDFGAEGELKTDMTFMTTADVPIIAAKDIAGAEPCNPWTGKPLRPEKKDGVIIATSILWDPAHHFKNRFNISADEWLKVRDNIFDKDKWSRVEVNEDKD